MSRLPRHLPVAIYQSPINFHFSFAKMVNSKSVNNLVNENWILANESAKGRVF